MAMMTTDDERREVARRLRDDLKDAKSNGHYCSDSEAVRYICDILGLRCSRCPHPWAGLEALADLIEPGEPKVMCVAEVKIDGERLEELVHDAAVELTGIDRDSLLELADEMENDTWYESSFDHRTATRFAHRIRKALKGES